MPLLKTNWKCLSLILLATVTQAMRQASYEKGIIPKIYKILDGHNKIILKETERTEFNKEGLLKFLLSNANLEYRVNNILNRGKEGKRGVKKRWIKRKVPHNRETPDIAFDKRFGLTFKPFVRLHKTKKVNLENDNRIQKLSGVQKDLNSLRTQFDLEEMKRNIEYGKIYTKEVRHIMEKLLESDHIVGEIGLPYLSGKMHKILIDHLHEIYPKIDDMHKEILDFIEPKHIKNKLLRDGHGKRKPVRFHELHHSSEMKGNAEDIIKYLKRQGWKPLRGGAPKIDEIETEDTVTTKRPVVIVDDGFTINPDEEDAFTELPKPLFPHQPLWSHWTNQQTLYDNECPPGQANIGTLCSRLPGHGRR